MKKVCIIDAFNYLFRSYYAIGPMTNNEGQSTSALFGFIRSIKKLLKDFSFDYLVCVFDGPDNKQSRKEVYANYKMHRKKAPDDLYPQFDLAYKFCSLSGIPVLCIPKIEADDVMASVAVWFSKKNMEVFLCTSDKDLFQLVDKNTHILLAHKNNLVVDKKKVKELLGVFPHQVLDYLSITGDASDNIPGISGFGPKTAASLLEQFSSLEEILKHPEKVAGKKKQETLVKEKNQALLSKKLATLNTHADFPKNLTFFQKKEPLEKELTEFYQKMKFSTFLKELKKTTPSEHKKVSYTLINSKAHLEKLEKLLSNQKEICIDTEASSPYPVKAELIGVGLGFHDSNYYIPLNGEIEKENIFTFLKKLLENPHKKFYGHNIKYDYLVLLNHNIQIQNIYFDTMLASYILFPQKRRHNLDLLSLEYFNKVKTSYKDLTKNKPLKDIDIQKVASYCAEDVYYTSKLKEIFEKKIKEEKLEKIFYDIEIPLISILAKMERHGIFLDKKKFSSLLEKFSKEILFLEKNIYHLAKSPFNINSPKQLSDILYKKLKLPFPKRKKTEYATGAGILEKLNHPLTKEILKYRTLQKLLSTYIKALPKEVDEKTQRIHPTFNQSIAVTGRLSCQDPNLQNIPVKSKEIRQGFKPEKSSWSFISFDYSQIELRILAHLSKDPELIQAFNKNEDIHAHTASLIFKVSLKNVTPKMRRLAKAINFGILYGQGAYGLSQAANISYKEAKKFIETYFEKYKKVADYIEKCKKEVREKKQVETLFGRIRPIFDIDNKNSIIRAQSERLAINTPLQGTSADIIKLAMIAIDKEISKKLKGYLILQIHDELIFEVPDNEIPAFKKLIKEKMEHVVKLAVPLTVDITIGKNWGEC